jgi:L-ascorbate metabolism protein UlaG (beta-lactamase superfamily)
VSPPRPAALAKWAIGRSPRRWPKWIDEAPGVRPPERVGGGELRVTFVNHATALVQMDGLNVLTDPVWSERVSPVSWAGPKRVRAPGIRFEDLPPIDLVLLSHNHYDHLDVPTMRRLADGHRPRILTGLGNVELFDAERIRGGEEMDWWDEREVAPGARVIATPAQHFSGRGPFDRNTTLWMAFVLEGPSGRVYFAGDTGYGPHFARARERLGAMRLALLPIGAYDPQWVMAAVHMDPAGAVRAHHDLEAGTSVGIHWGSFQLTDEGVDEPVRDLETALAADPASPRFWVLGHGEGRAVPTVEAPSWQQDLPLPDGDSRSIP